MNTFSHVPVLLQESITALNIKADGVYADGTAGGGNHSLAIGQHLNCNGRLICVDRDIEAIEACRQKLGRLSCTLSLLHSAFDRLPVYLSDNGILLDGLLVDLGVSSYQLDTAERGFSYMADAELDMRMNKEDAFDAKQLVNTYSKEDLERVFFEYGEERYARSIASAIVKQRQQRVIETTLQLVDIIKGAMPGKARQEKQHPAKRVFQAIRIEVNDELGQAKRLLTQILPCVNSGGRVCVITFHSLEDRLVKQTFAKMEHPCTCPPDFPVCVCGNRSQGKALKVISPSAAEVERNPRARSAKLRVFIKS